MRLANSLFRAFICALISLSLAADIVHVSRNRLPPADASHFASHGIASQLPHQNRLISACDDTRQAPTSNKFTSSLVKVSLVQVASVNVKALAHGGISYLFDLASSNDGVGDVGNGTAIVFPKPELSQNNQGFSGRKHVAYTSIALVLVMLFFTVWM